MHLCVVCKPTVVPDLEGKLKFTFITVYVATEGAYSHLCIYIHAHKFI